MVLTLVYKNAVTIVSEMDRCSSFTFRIIHSSCFTNQIFRFACVLYLQVYRNDDDLGFDPFTETQKALAEMIENEKQSCYYPHSNGNFNNNHLHSSSNNHHNSNSSRDSNSLLNNNNNSVYQKRFITMQQNNR